MNNDQIINAITVLRDVLKAANLSYKQADEMIIELKNSPVYESIEIERAFCGGFLANLKSLEDFKGDAIQKKFIAYQKSGFYKLMFTEPTQPNI